MTRLREWKVSFAHVQVMDSHKKYFSLRKSTSINKRVLDIIIHTMENSNNTSTTVPAAAKRKCTWKWPPCNKWMHWCISQRASKSIDRPSLPLFEGRFYIVKCYLMNQIPVVVSKRSSYWQWYCGETRPVCRLRISETFRACLDEYPRFIPTLVLSDHFLIFLWSCSSFFRTYVGHPKWCWFWIVGTLLVAQNLDIGLVSCSLVAR